MKTQSLEINNQLENPAVFFHFNGCGYSLDVVEHRLSSYEMDGEPEVELDFEVDQDWDNERTLFVFDDFTLAYSSNETEELA